MEDLPELPEGTPLYINLTAGALAGIAEHTVMYPFDFLKTRMQVINPSPAAVYTSATHALKTITSTEGIARLWRGVVSVLLGAGPAHAVYFGSYEFCKRHISRLLPRGADGSVHPLSASIAGASATIASDALMNPFDVVKQRMQLHNSQYRGVFNCAATLLKTEGLLAFYVSYPVTLISNVPFHSIQFPLYEYFRHLLSTSEYDPMAHIMAGGLAGGTAAALTTPIDVVKTFLQTKGASSDQIIRETNSPFKAAKIIYNRSGYSGFFRGWQPRVLTFVPSTAVCWGTYEYFKWIINRNIEHKNE